jgi:hypothetical protein
VYSYGPAAQNVHNFPPIWQPATLLANDSDGQALWSKIAGGVPNIAPKGQLNGSTINVTYNSANDPDCCEWAFFVPRSAVRGRRAPVGSWPGLVRSCGDGVSYIIASCERCEPFPGNLRDHPFADNSELIAHHFLLFGQGGRPISVRHRKSRDYLQT